jgi:hypothetical protein
VQLPIDSPKPRRKKRRAHSDSEEAKIALIGRSQILICLFTILSIGAIVLMVVRVRHPERDASRPIVIAQHFVTDRVGPDSVITFTSPERTKVQRSGDTVEVSGWFQVVPKSGRASSGYYYECVLNDTGGTWALMSLDLRKQ